ncbi:exodeoxyribonuclease VII large subunit, partial [Acinetobacter baumannii]
RFEGVAARLRPTPILHRVVRGREVLQALDRRAARALATAVARARQRLDARAQMLSALSYQGILARGFAIVRDGNGAMVRGAAAVSAGAALG